jgi:hypothetical protein
MSSGREAAGGDGRKPGASRSRTAGATDEDAKTRWLRHAADRGGRGGLPSHGHAYADHDADAGKHGQPRRVSSIHASGGAALAALLLLAPVVLCGGDDGFLPRVSGTFLTVYRCRVYPTPLQRQEGPS